MKKMSFFLISCLIAGLIACGGNGAAPDNNPPYDIIGPETPSPVPKDSTEDYVLVVDQQGGKNDPDGDAVTFKYEFVSKSASGTFNASNASIDEVNGIFSLTWETGMAGRFITFKFWTEDPGGLTSTEFEIEFNYQSS